MDTNFLRRKIDGMFRRTGSLFEEHPLTVTLSDLSLHSLKYAFQEVLCLGFQWYDVFRLVYGRPAEVYLCQGITFIPRKSGHSVRLLCQGGARTIRGENMLSGTLLYCRQLNRWRAFPPDAAALTLYRGKPFIA